MKRAINPRYALTFLGDVFPGPVVLIAGKTIQPCANPAAAEVFLKKHGRGYPGVLLGALKDGVTGAPEVKDLKSCRYIAVSVPISAKAALDPHPNSPERKTMRHTAPHFLIASDTHCVAGWEMLLPDYVKPARAEADLKAFCAWFSKENNCRCDPLMIAIPVPDLGNGIVWHHQRGRGQAIHHDQIMRVPTEKPKEDTKARKLGSVLTDFKISAKVAGFVTGPVITLFQVEPARGVKIAAFESVSRDIARAMKCESARVVELPNEGAIGIELPNKDRETVELQALLESPAFRKSKAALALALGKSIDGKPVVTDLATAPHLLMGGTTGSGKSVMLKTMIHSMIWRLPPADVNFVMADAKIDLSAYDGLPHMLAPVISDMSKVARVFGWGVVEMLRRYRIMKAASVVDLSEYNAKAKEKLPRIVFIIDELAELMSRENSAAVTPPMQRLAQMGRACGIHLIACTQRPSADVLSGTIKENFPSRIALKVSPGPNSAIILGEPGADTLLGKGDMLWLDGGGKITRVHGAFIAPDDVRAEVKRQQGLHGPPKYVEELTAILDDNEETGGETQRVATRRDDYLNVYATLTEPMQRHVRFLMTFFQSRLPATSDRVLNAAKPLGIREGGTLYRACDMLAITRQANGSNKYATWIPPQQWPEGFERVPFAAAE